MEDLQNTARKNKAIFLVAALMPWLKLSILPELNTILLNLELLVCDTACFISHTLLDFSLPLLFFFFCIADSCLSHVTLFCWPLGLGTLVLLSDISSASAGVGILKQMASAHYISTARLVGTNRGDTGALDTGALELFIIIFVAVVLGFSRRIFIFTMLTLVEIDVCILLRI